jgi:hypothetical protein
MKSGCFKEDGKVYLFDQFPEDSKITYGKLGYYRLGMTDLEEIRVGFRSKSTGTLTVEASLNGRDLETSLSEVITYTDSNKANINCTLSARWYNITISGHYDITNLEYRAHVTARR